MTRMMPIPTSMSPRKMKNILQKEAKDDGTESGAEDYQDEGKGGMMKKSKSLDF